LQLHVLSLEYLEKAGDRPSRGTTPLVVRIIRIVHHVVIDHILVRAIPAAGDSPAAANPVDGAHLGVEEYRRIVSAAAGEANSMRGHRFVLEIPLDANIVEILRQGLQVSDSGAAFVELTA